MDEQPLDSFEHDRIPIFSMELPPDPQAAFKEQTGNQNYRKSLLTYLTLFLLLIAYPSVTLIGAEDPETLFEGINDTSRIILLLVTIVVQWGMFLVVYLTAYREQTGLKGLGFTRPRFVHFLWACAFLPAAYLILAMLTLLLAQMDLALSGDIALLLPEDTPGRIVWILVSITAGVCEETAFRGFLMTRLRLLLGLHSWTIPVIISSIVFGFLHYSYQGLPGFILISAYGLMLALLYIYTGSLWPSIIAHFFQDFLALFIPQ